MSLFSALTVAVGGLNAQSRSIGHISDNISNASTTGFKRIDTQFQSLVTQSSAALSDPGGVRATPVYQNDIQGGTVQDQNATSLAVAGKGFFAVKQPSTSATGTTSFTGETKYTRRGDFTLDKNGYMTNGSGFVVTGYALDESGIRSDEVQPVQISALIDKPVATSTVTYKANLPASSGTGAAATNFSPSTVQVYDNFGAKHTLSFDWSKSATNSWQLAVNVADAQISSGVPTPVATQLLDFGFNVGSPGVTAGTINTVADANGTPFFTVPSGAGAASGQPVNVSFSAFFPGAGAQTINLNFGTFGQSAGVTQFDSTSLVVNSIEQNGIPQGSFRDLAIDADGYISANYDNGRTRTLYQLQLAQFNSPDNLHREDGGVFSSTIASGSPNSNNPGSNGNGKLVSNALEGSNVDIADEFTKMIQAQRVYSANAKTITTANSMLEEIINIIR
jgi:flagellar hook protein FlgE